MNILIVGGGTAGWSAAAYLSRSYNVTLVESSDVPIIGVGESTLPLMQKFCQDLELEESQWMDKCNAIHKLGIQHIGWKKDVDESWFHWFLYDRNGHDTFDHLEKGTLPQGTFEYAYHVDATKFGIEVMKPLALANGVTHIIDNVDDIVLDDDNSVDYVVLSKTGKAKYDLYVDCSGFAKIFAKKQNTEFQQYDYLKNDSAIACPQLLDTDIKRHTITRTMNHGWMWEISLQNRRGVGYVYSSEFCSDDEALEEYLEHWPNTDKSKLRVLKFTPGYAKTPFYKNVASIGLSAGFIEPLEANGIWLINFSIMGLYRCLQEGTSFDVFNRRYKTIMEDVKNFTISHYTLSELDHTPYWKHFNNLEKQLNTKAIVKEKGEQPDTAFGSSLNLFHPYSWWSKSKYFLRSK